MKRFDHDNTRSGYTLLELLGYLTVFTVLVNLSINLYVSTSRLTVAGIETLERLDQIERLGRRFTRVVHGAEAIVGEGAGYRTGPDLLVLRLGRSLALPNTKHYSIFGNIRGDGQITQINAVEIDGEVSIEYMMTEPLQVESIRFRYERGKGLKPLVRLEVEVDNTGARNTIPELNTFMAALAGP